MAKITAIKLNEIAPGGEGISTNISNANPDATDAHLYNFATALNDLTDNTFESAVRVDQTELEAVEP